MISNLSYTKQSSLKWNDWVQYGACDHTCEAWENPALAECIKEKFGAERVLHDYFGNNDFADIGWVNKFDVVVMYDLFEHVRDVDMALKKTAVILKPGGICAVVIQDQTKDFGKSLTSFRMIGSIVSFSGCNLKYPFSL